MGCGETGATAGRSQYHAVCEHLAGETGAAGSEGKPGAELLLARSGAGEQKVGIRMALGARPADVLQLMVWQGLKLTAAGLVIGLALALAAARSVSAISFASSAMGLGGKLLGVSASDPFIYAGAALFLTGVSLLAAYIPARRAAAIDPMEALRYE